MEAVTSTSGKPENTQLWPVNEQVGIEMHVIHGRDKYTTTRHNYVLKPWIGYYLFIL